MEFELINFWMIGIHRLTNLGLLVLQPIKAGFNTFDLNESEIWSIDELLDKQSRAVSQANFISLFRLLLSFNSAVISLDNWLIIVMVVSEFVDIFGSSRSDLNAYYTINEVYDMRSCNM